MNVTIAIDDVNPKKEWRIFGDKTEKYLFNLNKQFGAKFTLFIPSNHHNTGKLSENKSWVKELKDSGIFELVAHGHFHSTSDASKFGEMEFADMTEQECIEKQATTIAESLNTLIRIVRDVNEITHNDKKRERRMRSAKGWYDPKTGEVVIVLPNAESVGDVQATILHEVVGHKGLRGLLS